MTITLEGPLRCGRHHLDFVCNREKGHDGLHQARSGLTGILRHSWPQTKGGLCRAMKAYAGNTLLCTRDRGHPDEHQCGVWSWQ